jgi:hypothetical protein
VTRPDPFAYPPRGLNREEAARYVGVGATKFDEMVADRRMPRPKRVDGRIRCRTVMRRWVLWKAEHRRAAGPSIPTNHDGTSQDVVFRPAMSPLTSAKDGFIQCQKVDGATIPICPFRPSGG